MEGERHVAMLAAGHPSALLALQHGGIAATVLEEYDLLAALQCLAGLDEQQGGEGPVHHLTVLQVAGVNHLYLRQLDALVSLLKRDQGVLAGLGVMPRLCAGGGSAQEHFGAVHPGQHDGRRASMVAGGRVLLLIAGLVLLVDDDQAEALEG